MWPVSETVLKTSSFIGGWGRKRAVIIIYNIELDVSTIAQGYHEDAILTEIRYSGFSLYWASIYLPIDRYSKRPRYNTEHITLYKRGRTDTGLR